MNKRRAIEKHNRQLNAWEAIKNGKRLETEIQLTPAQKEMMKAVYAAFLQNKSFPTQHQGAAKKTYKSLKDAKLIGSIQIGNGVQHTGLTGKGIKYARENFPLFEIVE